MSCDRESLAYLIVVCACCMYLHRWIWRHVRWEIQVLGKWILPHHTDLVLYRQTQSFVCPLTKVCISWVGDPLWRISYHIEMQKKIWDEEENNRIKKKRLEQFFLYSTSTTCFWYLNQGNLKVVNSYYILLTDFLLLIRNLESLQQSSNKLERAKMIWSINVGYLRFILNNLWNNFIYSDIVI